MSGPDPAGSDPPAYGSGGAAAVARRDRRGTGYAVLGLVLLLIGLYAGAVTLSGDDLPAGTKVAGVRLGGLSSGAAEDRLRTELQPRAERPIELQAGGRTFSLDPAEAGLTLDVEATVARAHGGSRIDPRRLWTDLTATVDPVDPVVRVDQDKLITAVHRIAARFEQPAVEPWITFTARRPVPHPPANGRTVDTAETILRLLDAWLVDDDPIALAVDPVEPEVDEAVMVRALERVAKPAIDGPVRLEVSGRGWRLAPKDYAAALRLEVQDGTFVPVVRADVLARRVPQLVEAGRPPRDATVRIEEGEPVVVPARPGVTVAADDLAAGVVSALGSDDRFAEVAGKSEAPDVTTGQARRWGIREQVSSFTTYYPHEDYRNTNIGRAAELLNGTVLAPGDTFSFNGTVGERTAANGFTIGYIISDGVFAEDFGGGVSQAATTTFNAAFFAGMRDVEHKPHSFYIDRYPMGREATVAWPTVDLRFQNTTPYGVLIESFIVPSTPGGTGQMHVRMYSTKHWTIKARVSEPYRFTSPGTRVVAGPACVPQTGYSGFDVDVFRDFYRRGEKLRTEPMHTTYIPADTVICTG